MEGLFNVTLFSVGPSTTHEIKLYVYGNDVKDTQKGPKLPCSHNRYQQEGI